MAIFDAGNTFHGHALCGLWMAINLAVSLGPNATPGYGIDTLASKSVVSHTLLLASIILVFKEKKKKWE